MLQKYGETPENPLDYRYLAISGVFRGDAVTVDSSRAEELFGSGKYDLRQMYLIPVSDYNRLSGENIVLADNETAVYTVGEDYAFDRINIEEYGVFNIVGTNNDLAYIGESGMTDTIEISLYPTIFLLVRDEDILYKLNEIQEELYGGGYRMLHHYYGFDLSCGEEKQSAIGTEIQESIAALRNGSGAEWAVTIECASKDKAEFYALYGGLFFLGILLGTVFICAAALIMYYKQISEGFEDKAKYEILRKVGMTRTEIKESINSQVLTVFFAPLIAAGVHMAFAFGIISRMLALFGLVDSGLFAAVAMGCFLLFGLLYAMVYLLTSKRYYRIVSGKE